MWPEKWKESIALLWDLTHPGAEPKVLAVEKGWGESFPFSPNGRWLATKSGSTVLLWNLTNPDADPIVLKHEDSVRDVSFSPDGRWLATNSDDGALQHSLTFGTVRLWNLTSPAVEPKVLAKHEGWVTDVSFSPDGRWLVTSAANEKTARLWDLTDLNAEPKVLTGHEGRVTDVSFSPDGRWLATASWNKTARLWDLTSPGVKPTGLAGLESAVRVFAFSPDSRWLATVSSHPYWEKALVHWAPGGEPTVVALWDLTNPTGPIELHGKKC